MSVDDAETLIKQADALLQKAESMLTPPAAGMPAGVVSEGPGTIIAVTEVDTPFGPSGAVFWKMALDTGGLVEHEFYKPTVTVKVGDRVSWSYSPRPTPTDYDTLYAVEPAPGPVSG